MLEYFKYNKKQLLIFSVMVLWYIVSIEFYQYVGFPWTSLVANFAVLFATLMYCICFKDIFHIKYGKPISYLTIGVILSCLISVIYWNANPFYALQAASNQIGLLYVIVFFALHRFGTSPKTAHYVLLTLSIIYLFCWLYSMYKMPEMVFGIDRDNMYGMITERGFYRTFIPGNLLRVLCFYSLGLFLYKRKWIWLIISIITVVIIILHVGRQTILWTFLIAALMVYLQYRKKVIYLLLAVIMGYLTINYLSQEISAVSSMIEMSKDQGEDMENDVRVKAAAYFIDEYPHNPITAIFGNGVPARYTELDRIEKNARSRDFWMSDVGYFAVYCNYGLWTLFALVLLLVRVVKLNVPAEYKYCKYYIYSVYGVHIFSQGLTCFIFPVMIAYFILEKSASDKDSNQAYIEK